MFTIIAVIKNEQYLIKENLVEILNHPDALYGLVISLK